MRFHAVFSTSDQKLNVKFDRTDQRFEAKFDHFQEVAVDADVYEGAYEVTPQPTDQVLATGQKLMLGDVLVKAIPKEYGLVTYDQDRTITIT